MDKDVSPTADAPRFDLITHAGKPGFRLAFRDRGIAVEPDALVYVRDGRWQRLAFDSIISVQLALASTGGRGQVGVCTLRLRSGDKLVISTIASSGLADSAMDGVYRRFINAFHAALVASDATRHIGFSQGMSAVRRGILFSALIAGGILFIGAPLLALLTTGQLKALFVMFAGGALLYPFVQIYRVNAPKAYSAMTPPDLLP